MKNEMIFDMNDPLERERYKIHAEAMNLHWALVEIKNSFIQKLKNEALNEDQHNAYTLAYNRIKAIVYEAEIGHLRGFENL